MSQLTERDQLLTRQRLLEAAGEVFAEKGFRGGTVREICQGADAPDSVVHRCVRSIVGQVLFYHFARPMLVRVFPDEQMDVDTLAEHIASFSLGGLREIAVERKAAS